MIEVAINGKEFRIGKLDAFKQFHVLRRIAPLLAKLTGNFDQAMLGVAEALSKMSDEDSEYVLKSCLSVCQRKQGTWAPVMKAGNMMFDDIDVRDMMQLAVEVIKENAGPFFDGGLGLPDNQTQN